MEKTNKKSRVVFNLEFTTSKLLAYIVVILGSLIGYLLVSSEIVVLGFVMGGALSGAKSVTDNLTRKGIKNIRSRTKSSCSKISNFRRSKRNYEKGESSC